MRVGPPVQLISARRGSFQRAWIYQLLRSLRGIRISTDRLRTSSGEILKGQKETSRSGSREVAKSPRSLTGGIVETGGLKARSCSALAPPVSTSLPLVEIWSARWGIDFLLIMLSYVVVAWYKCITISSGTCCHLYGDESGPARPADKCARGSFLRGWIQLPRSRLKTSSGEISKGQKETSRSGSREVAKCPRSLTGGIVKTDDLKARACSADTCRISFICL